MTVDECFSGDPIYQRIKALFCAGNTAKTRAELQMNLVKMSAIQNEFTRTTKRQVYNEQGRVNERFPSTVKITLLPDEQKTFDQIVNDYETILKCDTIEGKSAASRPCRKRSRSGRPSSPSD